MFLQHRTCIPVGVPIGVVGTVSGYAIAGRAAAAGMQAHLQEGRSLGNAIIYAVMVETYAILAFIIFVSLCTTAFRLVNRTQIVVITSIAADGKNEYRVYN